MILYFTFQHVKTAVPSGVKLSCSCCKDSLLHVELIFHVWDMLQEFDILNLHYFHTCSIYTRQLQAVPPSPRRRLEQVFILIYGKKARLFSFLFYLYPISDVINWSMIEILDLDFLSQYCPFQVSTI